MSGLYPKAESWGPETVLIDTRSNARLRLVFLDTEWFLHSHCRHNGNLTKPYTYKHKEHILDSCLKQLDAILATSEKKGEWVIISCHHPIYTIGDHYRARGLVNTAQRGRVENLNNKHYRYYADHLAGVLSKYDSVILACGHDHNFQYFENGNIMEIVSGAGSKFDTQSSCAEKPENCKKVQDKFRAEITGNIDAADFRTALKGYKFLMNGYVRIDFFENHRPAIKVILIDHETKLPEVDANNEGREYVPVSTKK